MLECASVSAHNTTSEVMTSALSPPVDCEIVSFSNLPLLVYNHLGVCTVLSKAENSVCRFLNVVVIGKIVQLMCNNVAKSKNYRFKFQIRRWGDWVCLTLSGVFVIWLKVMAKNLTKSIGFYKSLCYF